MDWKQFIAELISTLAWPAVGAMFLIMFRSELTKIAGRLARVKYKDLEMEFDRVKLLSKELVPELENQKVQAELASKSPVYGSLEEQISNAVETAPSAAILIAWSALEASMTSAVARLSISGEAPSYRSPKHNIDSLIKSGELSKNHEQMLDDMRMLRNKVAHGHDSIFSITPEQARDYARTAIYMTKYFEDLQRDD